MMKMKRSLCSFLAVFFVCVCVFCVPAAAETGSVHLLDYADVIHPDNEKQIMEKAEEVAEHTGFNIVIVAADDIGTPKTDAHVVEYADDKYEELCGINTDGILFLINCDTKYDYISTSGVCINYFSDARIDQIFDDIWDYLKEENYAQAAYSFVLRVDKYYNAGKANNQTEILGREVDLNIAVILGGMFIPMVFALIVGFVVFAAFSAQYRMQKPGTRNYILDNSIAYDRKLDEYIGTNVNRIYTPRSSSSSGHRSGGSHRSSTHHSHSGGRHGGGGRHR